MREIVLDTETTGLNPSQGHRVVEIGAVKLQDHIPTGREFHAYINPQRSMPEEAFKVHGLSRDFLSSQPLFEDIHKDFLSFIEGDVLIFHNASFDMNFINAELQMIDPSHILENHVIDTLLLARERFPGQPNNLDALCKRFCINLERRVKHGALLDARLLVDVYLELLGGRQRRLDFLSGEGVEDIEVPPAELLEALRKRNIKKRLTLQEEERHINFLKTLS